MLHFYTEKEKDDIYDWYDTIFIDDMFGLDDKFGIIYKKMRDFINITPTVIIYMQDKCFGIIKDDNINDYIKYLNEDKSKINIIIAAEFRVFSTLDEYESFFHTFGKMQGTIDVLDHIRSTLMMVANIDDNILEGIYQEADKIAEYIFNFDIHLAQDYLNYLHLLMIKKICACENTMKIFLKSCYSDLVKLLYTVIASDTMSIYIKKYKNDNRFNKPLFCQKISDNEYICMLDNLIGGANGQSKKRSN